MIKLKINIYKNITEMKFVFIFINFVIFCLLTFFLSDFLILKKYYSKWLEKMIIALPIFIHFFLVSIVFIKNKKNLFMNLIYILNLFQIIILSFILFFKLNIKNDDSSINFFIIILISQILFQLLILIINEIMYKIKKIKISILRYPTVLILLIIILSIVYFFSYFLTKHIRIFSLLLEFIENIGGICIFFILFISYFNPVLIYILSLVAKGELLTGDKNTLKDNVYK
jgi:hypothetical protein